MGLFQTDRIQIPNDVVGQYLRRHRPGQRSGIAIADHVDEVDVERLGMSRDYRHEPFKVTAYAMQEHDRLA